jgi:hypothetical protein
MLPRCAGSAACADQQEQARRIKKWKFQIANMRRLVECDRDCGRCRKHEVRVIASEGSGNRAGSFTIAVADQAAGGPTLRTMSLSEDLFAAAAMKAVEKDLMDMKVTELKEELASRDEPVSGNKAWLRRRLHAAILREQQ